MDDRQIVDLYFQRSEQAIAESDVKYGKYCFRIAYGILTDQGEAEESVNDTFLAAWNAIPPRRPAVLATFLGKITRNLSISRWRKRSAEKRGNGEFPLCLEELDDCVSGMPNLEQQLAAKETVSVLNAFLEVLPAAERKIFLRRYWFMESTAEIAEAMGCTQTKITTTLNRTRKKLRTALEKEGLL